MGVGSGGGTCGRGVTGVEWTWVGDMFLCLLSEGRVRVGAGRGGGRKWGWYLWTGRDGSRLDLGGRHVLLFERGQGEGGGRDEAGVGSGGGTCGRGVTAVDWTWVGDMFLCLLSRGRARVGAGREWGVGSGGGTCGRGRDGCRVDLGGRHVPLFAEQGQGEGGGREGVGG